MPADPFAIGIGIGIAIENRRAASKNISRGERQLARTAFSPSPHVNHFNNFHALERATGAWEAVS
jgi:hypothetical protein